jgi:hypothetical protein
MFNAFKADLWGLGMVLFTMAISPRSQDYMVREPRQTTHGTVNINGRLGPHTDAFAESSPELQDLLKGMLFWEIGKDGNWDLHKDTNVETRLTLEEVKSHAWMREGGLSTQQLIARRGARGGSLARTGSFTQDNSFQALLRQMPTQADKQHIINLKLASAVKLGKLGTPEFRARIESTDSLQRARMTVVGIAKLQSWHNTHLRQAAEQEGRNHTSQLAQTQAEIAQVTYSRPTSVNSLAECHSKIMKTAAAAVASSSSCCSVASCPLRA